MKVVSLTHANTGGTADLQVAKIFYYYWSDALKATLVVSDAGAYFPAREGFDDVKRRISEALRSDGKTGEGFPTEGVVNNGT